MDHRAGASLVRSGLDKGHRCPKTSIVLPELAQEHLLVCGKSAFAPPGIGSRIRPWGSVFCGTLSLYTDPPSRPHGTPRAGIRQRDWSLCRVALDVRLDSFQLFHLRGDSSPLHLVSTFTPPPCHSFFFVCLIVWICADLKLTCDNLRPGMSFNH